MSDNSSLQFAYYSHHKCATGWTNSIMREVCFHLGFSHKTAHGPQQYGKAGGLAKWVQIHGVESLAYTNAEIEEARKLPQHKGFHVVRDPRDVLVSGYFSHKNSHPMDQWPELIGHRESLQSLPKEKGLLKEIEFSRPFLEAMADWNYGQDHILEIKMEDLTRDPDNYFHNIFDYLGYLESLNSLSTKLRQYANRVVYKAHHEMPVQLPHRVWSEKAVHTDILNKIIDAHRFEKMTKGRVKGETDTDSHYRKGQPGDWKNHFTDRIAQVFEREYGDIIQKLGYKA